MFKSYIYIYITESNDDFFTEILPIVVSILISIDLKSFKYLTLKVDSQGKTSHLAIATEVCQYLFTCN